MSGVKSKMSIFAMILMFFTTPVEIVAEEGVDIVALYKTLKSLKETISSISGRPAKQKVKKKKKKNSRIKGCALTVDYFDEQYCKASISELSRPEELFIKDKDSGRTYISVREKIIGQRNRVGEMVVLFPGHFKKSEEHKAVYDFKGHCRSRYVSGWVGHEKQYFNGVSLDFNRVDEQLYLKGSDIKIHKWPALIDEQENVLCEAGLKKDYQNLTDENYIQLESTNKTEIAIKKSAKYKMLKLSYKTKHNPSFENLKMEMDYKYQASKECNRFVKNIMKENLEVIFAYCSHDKPSELFSADETINIIANDSLTSIFYRDRNYDVNSMDINLYDKNFNVDLSTLPIETKY